MSTVHFFHQMSQAISSRDEEIAPQYEVIAHKSNFILKSCHHPLFRSYIITMLITIMTPLPVLSQSLHKHLPYHRPVPGFQATYAWSVELIAWWNAFQLVNRTYDGMSGLHMLTSLHPFCRQKIP